MSEALSVFATLDITAWSRLPFWNALSELVRYAAFWPARFGQAWAPLTQSMPGVRRPPELWHAAQPAAAALALPNSALALSPPVTLQLALEK